MIVLARYAGALNLYCPYDNLFRMSLQNLQENAFYNKKRLEFIVIPHMYK